MKIHVIDTRRTLAWRGAFTDGHDFQLTFAHEYNPQEPIAVGPEDFVFAHAHEDAEGDWPDFPVTDWRKQYRRSVHIQAFVELLRKLDNAMKPHVILYSGGDTSEPTRNQWIKWSIGSDGPLEGYPEGRVSFHPGVVASQSSAVSLQAFVKGVVEALSLKVGASASLDITWLEETRFAARLLVEAAGLSTDQCSGIKVVKPPPEIAQLASEVTSPSAGGQSLAASARALCEKLASHKW